jgi:flagellar biosynthetic protein FliQ
MTPEMAIEILRSAVMVSLTLMAPILVTAIGVGLIVSILQTITSIQEQTLTFVPKMIAVSIVLMISAHWMIRTIVDYSVWLFQRIPSMAA